MKHQVYFSKNQAHEMGEFIAGLVQHGVVWTSQHDVDGWTITLTGGF